jgi:hypothetical protein
MENIEQTNPSDDAVHNRNNPELNLPDPMTNTTQPEQHPGVITDDSLLSSQLTSDSSEPLGPPSGLTREQRAFDYWPARIGQIMAAFIASTEEYCAFDPSLSSYAV